MNDKVGRIGYQEGVFLFSLSMICKEIFVKQYDKFQSNYNSWQSVAIMGFFTLIFFLICERFISKTGKKDLFEAIYSIAGKKIGNLIIMIYAFTIFLGGTYIICEFTMIIKTYVFLGATIKRLIASMVIASGICALMGFESVARASKFFIIFFIAAFGVVFFAKIKNYQIANLYPLYGNGDSMLSALRRIPSFSEALLILFFAKPLHGIAVSKKIGITSIAFATIFCFVFYVAVSLSFPFSILQTVKSPFYRLLGMLEVGKYYQRLEDLLLFIMLMGALISTSISIFATSSLFCSVSKVKDSRITIFVVCVLTFVLSVLINNNFKHVENFDVLISRNFWIIYLAPILICSAIAFLKNKKSKKMSIKRQNMMKKI